MKAKKGENNGKAWLKREMRPYRASIALLTVLNVTATVLSLAFAYLVSYVINSATNGNAKLLWTFSAVILGMLLLKILLKTIDSFYAEKLRAKIVTELRTKLFSKILHSDYASILQYHSGDMLNRLTSDVQEVAADTVGLIPTLTGMCVQCVGAILALVTIDPIFTAIYVVCGLIFGGIAAITRKHLKKCHKEVLQADGEHRAYMQEGMSSVMTLKAYGAEVKTVERSSVFAQKYYEKRMKRNVLRSSMNGIFSLLSNAGLIFAVVWCGATVLYKGNDDYGSMLSVILLLMQFQHPLAGFSSVIPAYYSRLASGERLAELDEMPKENLAVENEKIDYTKLLNITFQNVCFSYGREEVLANVDAKFDKGNVICLTGASGSGKSTIFKLLLDVFAPTSGAVHLCFADNTSMQLSAKQRSLFAYVPQGNFLFSGSIRENLIFFMDDKENAEAEEKIRNALKIACADFVWDLPEGLQTSLSEGGGGLSEGQMQRLAVARAILSERPILLLDEATSALDGETERALLENIRNLKEKTCLIVTHRPAALAIADCVIKVENGKIISTK